MKEASSPAPVFGGNPGNFRQPKTLTLPRVLIRIAQPLQRGAFREGLHAGIVGLCNLGNQWFRRNAQPRYACSCCGQTAYSFLHLSNRLRIAWNSSCPACDSRSRHRGLALLIPRVIAPLGGRQTILHFAPEAILRQVLLCLPNVEYRTTDLFVPDVDFPGENLEALSFRTASFDVALCNHVLEHVPNDEAALAELARILTPAGVAVITIPGKWDRSATVTFPTTDLNGHYRDYGMDIKERLERYFKTVEVFNLHDLDQTATGLSHGIRPNEPAFICRHPRLSQAAAGK